MATLHLVGCALGDGCLLEQCLARAGEGDAVLLIEDAVVAAVKGGVSGQILRAASGRVAIHVLVPDLDARSLGLSNLLPGVQPVDYPGFVALTTAHNPIVSWF